MPPAARSLFPVLVFLALYLPAGAVALVLGLWAAVHAPNLAPAIQLGLGTAAFAVAVDGASECCLRGPRSLPLIRRILHLRRNRRRHALAFALLGAALAGAADLCAGLGGADIALRAGPGRIVLAAALLFPLAWAVIDAASGRPGLIRRALAEALAARS